jgi:hypothetical protein
MMRCWHAYDPSGPAAELDRPDLLTAGSPQNQFRARLPDPFEILVRFATPLRQDKIMKT